LGNEVTSSSPWIYVPEDQLTDPKRRDAMGIGDDVEFKTKPELAVEICRDMLAAATMPPWAAGDEVYGRSGDLRTVLEDHGVGYVLRVGKAFHVDLAPGVKLRADQAINKHLTDQRSWQVAGGTRFQRPAPLRLGVDRHHKPTALPAHPQTPDQR
jgi:SRSO17 transposase